MKEATGTEIAGASTSTLLGADFDGDEVNDEDGAGDEGGSVDDGKDVIGDTDCNLEKT